MMEAKMETTDLVERLLAEIDMQENDYDPVIDLNIVREAADTITALQARVSKLEGLLCEVRDVIRKLLAAAMRC